MSKAARWLDLIAFLLQHRFPVTRSEIFESVSGFGLTDVDPDDRRPGAKAHETARRMFERDKDELRALGIEIETLELAGRAADEASIGYRLRAEGVYLPYVQLEETAQGDARAYPALRQVALSPEELDVLDRATSRVAAHPSRLLAAAARSARRKLAFDVPLTVERIERLLGESGREEPDGVLEVLQQAVARGTRVTCRYYSIGRDTTEDRRLEPYGLFFRWGHWYCVATDAGEAKPKVFRVDRIAEPRVARGRDAEHRGPPEGFDLRAYLGRSAWDLSDAAPTRAVVRFRFPEARWVVAQGVGEVRERMLEDGGATIEFAVRDPEPFLRWLLTFLDHAVILEPAELAARLAELRERVAQLYAADA
jgi:predicted DNA-binding transcriptional regulator YafY